MVSGLLEALRTAAPGAAASFAGPLRAIHMLGPWPARTAYALFRPGSRVPSVILKVATNRHSELRLRTEHAALVRIAELPALAGRVPAPLGLFTLDNAVVLAQSGLAGVPLNVLLHRRVRLGPRSSARDHALVSDWLGRLHAHGEGAFEVVDAETLEPRLEQALPQDLPHRREIRDLVVARGKALGPLRVPLVAVHGDLVPSNCLVSEDGLNVIDWERSVPSATPLAEVLVFLTFYARRVPAARRSALAPVPAFRRAFVEEGWLADVSRTTWRRQVEALQLPAEAADYLFVATLADLATGHDAAAHARRAAWRSQWSELLAVYASERVRSSFGTA